MKSQSEKKPYIAPVNFFSSLLHCDVRHHVFAGK